MTATLAEFRTMFPEFDSPVATDEQVQAKLDLAARMMDVARWGDLFDDGQLFYAAHLLSVSLTCAMALGQGAGLFALKARTVDDVSVTFNVPQATNDFEAFYNSTCYGQQFQLLVRCVGVGALAVTS